jgi:hypothetical protein
MRDVERFERIHHAQVMPVCVRAGFGAGCLLTFDVEVLKAGLRRVVF